MKFHKTMYKNVSSTWKKNTILISTWKAPPCAYFQQKDRLPHRKEIQVTILCHELHFMEEEMAAHSSIPAWEISWTEEPRGLQSMRWQRARHNLVTKQQQAFTIARQYLGASLSGSVVVRLPMKETQIQTLIKEDPICCRATKPMCHNYWACALEPKSWNHWRPCTLELVPCNKRRHHNEKLPHHN